jgi:Ca2+-binding RTX toxin-like protein
MAKIKGNKKNNKLKGTGQNDKILGFAGDDKLTGKAGDDKLIGGDGDDFLDGGTGNDVMKGGAGNDFFEAGEGGDFFVGGSGIDTVSFAKQAFGISVELLTMTTTFDGLQDGFSGIENIDGTQSSDTIEGNGSANHFRGFGANDYLKGGDGNDILDGGEGNDQVYSDNGADQLIGGNGFDSLVYEKAASGAVINLSTNGGGGSAAGDTFSSFERVFGTQFGDNIRGRNDASEAFFGNAGDDDLFGRGGNDTLFGGAGKDDLDGGEGNDRLSPEGDVAEADHLFGGDGSDWADYDNAGAAVTVNLINGTGSQRAFGDTYDSIENVQGSDYNDTLVAGLNGRAYGGWGDDIIFDAGGSEVLRGERGADQLTDSFLGSEDGLRDIFVLEVNLGMDTIGGFTQSAGAAGDRFWLQESQFDIVHNSIGSLGAGQILNATNSNATTAAHRLIFNTNAKILYYDADGNGNNAAPIAIANIPGLGAISASDFVVVPDL